MKIVEDLFYTKEHEWVKIEGDKATIGITDYAQDTLGDVTFVELPEVDKEVEQFKTFSLVESVKAASDVYAPLSGRVIEINKVLKDSPELINQSPYTDGWFIKIEIKDIKEKENLLSAKGYEEFLKSLD